MKSSECCEYFLSCTNQADHYFFRNSKFWEPATLGPKFKCCRQCLSKAYEYYSGIVRMDYTKVTKKEYLVRTVIDE